MFNNYALLLTELVDATKPSFHAVVQLQIFAQCHKVAAADGLPVNMGFVQHQIHVGQDTIHLFIFCQVRRFFPKCISRHAQVRNEGVSLHVRGAQSFIKIIH